MRDVDFKINIHLDTILHIMLLVVSKLRYLAVQSSSRNKQENEAEPQNLYKVEFTK